MLTEAERKTIGETAEKLHVLYEEIRKRGNVTDTQMLFAFGMPDFHEKREAYLKAIREKNWESEKKVFGSMSFAERALLAGSLWRYQVLRLERGI